MKNKMNTNTENKQTLLIGLTGMMVAGKGTIAQYLKDYYGAETYRFSTPLRDILDRMHTEKSRENMQTLSTVLRHNFGEDILAKMIKEDIKNSSNPIAVVDGIRRWGDIELLKEGGVFVLTSVETSPETRYKRLINRAENEGDAQKTYEQFLEEQWNEADAQIPKIMEKTNEKIDNEGPLDELYKQVDEIIQKYEQ